MWIVKKTFSTTKKKKKKDLKHLWIYGLKLD